MTTHQKTPSSFFAWKTRAVAFVRRRLSPKGDLGLHLTIGIAVVVVASAIFGEFTEDVVTHDPSLQSDVTVAQYFHERATPAMTTVMKGFSLVGSGNVLTPAACVVGLWLGWKRRWYRMLMLLLCLPGGAILNVLTKGLIARQRPVFENPIETLTSYSFPSGHTVGAMTFYGLLAVWVLFDAKRLGPKIAACAGAALIIGCVALSRVYLGVHYLSDVLGAMAAGAAWVAFCVTAVETYRQRKLAQRRGASRR